MHPKNTILCKAFVTVLLLGVVSCRPADEPVAGAPPPGYTTLDSTYLILQDFYYWNHLLPGLEEFKPGQFRSPDELVAKVREFSPLHPQLNVPVDRWSFAMSAGQWSSMVEGQLNDFGIGLRFAAPDDLRLSWVVPGTEAEGKGLTRGMRVTAINDLAPRADNAGAINALFGENTSLTFTLLTTGGRQLSVNLGKRNYSFNPIISHRVFSAAGRKIGYMHFLSFTGSARPQMRDLFGRYKAQQVEELIIDLRYNGGGLLSVMEELASYIVPEEAVNKVFYQLQYNRKYEAFNEKVFFRVNPNRLPVRKVYFITSMYTASASEILIHSLKPYLDVQVIGQPSQGKLLGMQTIPYGGYMIVPVTFLALNARESEREFTYQIAPDQLSPDDLYADFTEAETSIALVLQQHRSGRLPHGQRKAAAYAGALVGSHYVPLGIKGMRESEK